MFGTLQKGEGDSEADLKQAENQLEKEEMQVEGKEELDYATPQGVGFLSFALDRLC